jgi:hypothetical protein
VFTISPQILFLKNKLVWRRVFKIDKRYTGMHGRDLRGYLVIIPSKTGTKQTNRDFLGFRINPL